MIFINEDLRVFFVSGYSEYVYNSTAKYTMNYIGANVLIQDSAGNITKVNCETKLISTISNLTIPDSATVYVGNTYQIPLTLTPTNADKNEIKYDVTDGKAIIKINGYGKVIQVNDDIDLENEKVYLMLEDMINEEIDDEVTKYLDDTMKEDIDILGLKDLYYKKTKKKIENIKYEIDVNVNINKNGSLYEALYE